MSPFKDKCVVMVLGDNHVVSDSCWGKLLVSIQPNLWEEKKERSVSTTWVKDKVLLPSPKVPWDKQTTDE